MRNFIFYFFVLFSSILSAQEFESEIKNSLKEKPKFDFRFDNRNSFISQSGVRVFGVKAGVQFADKLSFGIGYNFLWSDLEEQHTQGGITYQSRLRFYNISPYLEYVFYEDQQWQLAIPVQIGFGESYYENKEDFGSSSFNRRFVVSYEPAIALEYRILDYFGIGAGVGYRLMIVPNPKIDQQFTAPVYIFKFKIYFEKLLSDYAP